VAAPVVISAPGRFAPKAPMIPSSGLARMTITFGSIRSSRNGFLSRGRQLALGFFGSNAMEVQKRLYSIFGFNLDRLVSGYS
jgi:hypothetical protein